MNLSIIISNRNDTTMLAVTIRSCIEALKPLGLDNCEIVIVDNSDLPIYKLLPSYIPTLYVRERLVKIYRQDFPCLFSARETAASNALGEYILCLDSHMLVGHNMFLDLYNFMEERKDDPTLGFAHAPINWAHHHECRARHDRDMTINELGDWNLAYDTEQTITWKGMPWICRRDWFLDKDEGIGAYGALADHKLSWGGGDMHIGVKPWLLGYKNWAVPCSPGIHIGPFPKVDQPVGKDGTVNKDISTIGPDKYRLYGKSGVGPHTIGFLVSCYILGGEDMMDRNKDILTARFGRYLNVEKTWEQAKEYGKDEKAWLAKRRVYGFKELLAKHPWDN